MNHTKLGFTLGLMLYIFFISGCGLNQYAQSESPFEQVMRVECGEKGKAACEVVDGLGGGLCDGDPYLYIDETNGVLGVLTMNKQTCERGEGNFWYTPTELQSRKNTKWPD
jgi:hypothetical protein